MRSQSKHSLRTVRTHRSACALARGARTGVRMTSAPSLRKHLVEGTPELPVAVPDQEPKRLTVGGHDEIARLLGHAGGVGVGTDAAQAHAAASHLDEEQHVEPPQRHGFHGEEVAGHDAGRLGTQELRPRRPAALSCRSEALGAQHVADGGGRHRDAELAQLPLDPQVAPPPVLSSQAHDHLSHGRVEGRAADTPMGISPAPAKGVATPAQDGGGRDDEG